VQEQEVLRRQLAEQELLLKAYQAENEMAVARIKQQAAQHAAAAAEATRQIEELQQALAVAQVERERRPPRTPAVDAARLQELLRLQAELESTRAAAAQQEREAQQQVGMHGCACRGERMCRQEHGRMGRVQVAACTYCS